VGDGLAIASGDPIGAGTRIGGGAGVITAPGGGGGAGSGAGGATTTCAHTVVPDCRTLRARKTANTNTMNQTATLPRRIRFLSLQLRLGGICVTEADSAKTLCYNRGSIEALQAPGTTLRASREAPLLRALAFPQPNR
jgi:hypothetical protein